MNNNDEDFEEVVLDAFSYIVIATIVLFICILGGISIYNNYIKDNTTSKNIIEHVDSIKKENDKLIIEVNNLDSIKNAEIIEVKNLDNDSTVKLFYKLIRE